MKIKTHGILAEIIGEPLLELKSIKDTNALVNTLIENYSSIKKVNFTIVVNDVVVNKNTQLSDNDQIKIIPMFEGG